jgi:hypothetical protein
MVDVKADSAAMSRSRPGRGSAVVEGANEVAKGLLGAASDSLADVYGVVLGDRIANWRLANVMKAHPKVQAEATRRGLKLRPEKIPNRFAYSWFEEVSKQDDDDLQTLFARLLAKVAGGSTPADERLIQLLSKMAPSDAKLFELFYNPANTDKMDIFSMRRRQGVWAPIQRRSLEIHAEHELGSDISLEINSLLNIGAIAQTFILDQKRISITNSNLSRLDVNRVLKETFSQRECVIHTALGRALATALFDTKVPDEEKNAGLRVSEAPAD